MSGENIRWAEALASEHGRVLRHGCVGLVVPLWRVPMGGWPLVTCLQISPVKVGEKDGMGMGEMRIDHGSENFK